MENFDRIRQLGKALSHDTRNMKHKFNEKWVENLILFYKENRGKKLIHLSDIEDNLFIKLDKRGRKVLLDITPSKMADNNSIRAVKLYLSLQDKFISLKNLKHFLDKNINIIEPYIKEIKTTKSGIGKSIKNPKFPISLETEFGAVLLGNYPDTAIRTGSFSSKDKELLYELEKLFNKNIGQVKALIWHDSVYHMELSSTIKILYKLSGLNISDRQIITNNGIPYWAFFSSDIFQKTLLRKLWDAEGSAPNNKKMCLGQSVVLKKISEEIPLYPKRKYFVSCENKNEVLGNPPNLIISTQLFLYKFGIISYAKPHRLYKKKNGLVVCDWHLIITRYPNIKNFYNEIGFGLERKQKKLKDCLDSYSRNYPKEKIDREEEILKVAKTFKKFTILDIEGKIELSRGTLGNYLTWLMKKKKIEKIRTIPQKNTSSFLNEYRIRDVSNDKSFRTR